jgi:hypothetical protein
VLTRRPTGVIVGEVIEGREPPAPAPGVETDDVDWSLLVWYRQLSVVERLRAASRVAATLERLARAASTNG